LQALPAKSEIRQNECQKIGQTMPDQSSDARIALPEIQQALVELTFTRDLNIFASKYQLYLPSKEELKRQLEEAAGIILIFRSHRSLSSETISLFSTPWIIT